MLPGSRPTVEAVVAGGVEGIDAGRRIDRRVEGVRLVYQEAAVYAIVCREVVVETRNAHVGLRVDGLIGEEVVVTAPCAGNVGRRIERCDCGADPIEPSRRDDVAGERKSG